MTWNVIALQYSSMSNISSYWNQRNYGCSIGTRTLNQNGKQSKTFVDGQCDGLQGQTVSRGGKPPGMQAAPVNLKPAAKGMSPNSSIHETGRTIIIYSTIFKWKIAGRNLDLKTEFVHTRHFLVTTEDLPFTFEKKQWNFEGLWSPWDSIFIALIRDQNKN